jgi:hypothetical protein
VQRAGIPQGKRISQARRPYTLEHRRPYTLEHACRTLQCPAACWAWMLFKVKKKILALKSNPVQQATGYCNVAFQPTGPSPHPPPPHPPAAQATAHNPLEPIMDKHTLQHSREAVPCSSSNAHMTQVAAQAPTELQRTMRGPAAGT